MMTSMGPQDLKSFATFICLCLTRSRSRQQKKINDTIENALADQFIYYSRPIDRPNAIVELCAVCAHLASSFNR